MPTPDDLPLDPMLEEVTEDLPDATQLILLNAEGSADAGSNYLAEGDLDRHAVTEMSATSLFSNLFTDGREFRTVECKVSKLHSKD